LDIVIVGAGAVAEKFYLPALNRFRGDIGRLAVVDINAAQRDKMALHGLVSYDSLEKAAAAGFRAAIVAVPNRFHRAVSMEAMRLGLDVLVEKPLAETGVEALEMVEFAAASGRILAVNQTRRLFGTSRFIRDVVASGEYGALKSIRYEDGVQFNWSSVDGAYTRTDLGRVGVIADVGSHVIDVIAWWTGDGLELLRCRHDGWKGPEAFAHIELGGKAEAAVKISRLGRLNNTFDVRFEDARLYGDTSNWTAINIERRGQVTRRTIDKKAKVYSDMADVLLADFIAAATERRAPLFPAQQSLAGMTLIDACYERAELFDHPWYASIVQAGRE
jgi:predicted dehydrogenase